MWDYLLLSCCLSIIGFMLWISFRKKVDMVNHRKSPIQDEYIEKYLAEKNLDLTATQDAEMAYSAADFVVIAAPTNVYSTNRIDVASSKRTCFAHYMGC